ncbi:type II membrane protein [Gelatoporia subvermispora B]|uniref:Type II membrane protein n=1 Tax=Ceriporiopsis subvermispora (strain B) TaxID=914234 RepID=M2RGA7_CERS8|nr:type II membrane protein [Gelatoporia subvermispora B]
MLSSLPLLASPILLLSLAARIASAQDDSSNPFDCLVTYDGFKYDLTGLKGEHELPRTIQSPPSEIVDTVRFDLCADLTRQDGVADEDQCPSGTRACLTKTLHKGSEPDRIFAAIPLAGSSADGLVYSTLSSPKGISITFNGSSYPSPTTGEPIPQSFNVKLICETDTENSDPTFTSYDGQALWIEWHASAGCGFQGAPDAPSKKPAEDIENPSESERVGSGVGYFFLLLFLAFLAYFGLGAYYNYSTYGATGKDLIPHRDFWREVPYMLQDVASHLCSAVRPRHSSGRGGYIAV